MQDDYREAPRRGVWKAETWVWNVLGKHWDAKKKQVMSWCCCVQKTSGVCKNGGHPVSLWMLVRNGKQKGRQFGEQEVKQSSREKEDEMDCWGVTRACQSMCAVDSTASPASSLNTFPNVFSTQRLPEECEGWAPAWSWGYGCGAGGSTRGTHSVQGVGAYVGVYFCMCM